jgi:hypothetical protein
MERARMTNNGGLFVFLVVFCLMVTALPSVFALYPPETPTTITDADGLVRLTVDITQV